MASLKMAALLVAMMCGLTPEGEARATPQSAHYDAVVVEFAARGRATAEPALAVVARNWAAMERIVDEHKGADVVVFPEVGLTGMEVPGERPLLRPLLSRVPDPASRPRPVPCDAPAPAAPTVSDVVRNASCAARRSAVYLVVNLPEEAPCAGEPDCPPDGFFIYNTNVVFDRTGALIVRYRKTHLYVEPGFNSGREGQRPVFDSDFGVRFATFICFDIMFEDPTLKAVREMGATDILHNSAWFSTPPFFTAIQLQGNWAHATNVTLLSSGLNRPSGSQTGSGIYWGDRGAMRAVLQQQFGTTVLRVRVPKRPASPPAPPPPPPPPAPPTLYNLTLPEPPLRTSTAGQLLLYRETICSAPSVTIVLTSNFDCQTKNKMGATGGEAFPTVGWMENIGGDQCKGAKSSGYRMLRASSPAQEDLSAWTTVLLPPAGGVFNTTLCHGSLCCRVEALTEAPPPSAARAPRYFYRAVAFDGMMPVATLAALGEQACGVVACLDANDLLSCGGVDTRAVAGLRFKRISVRAAGFQRARALQLYQNFVEKYINKITKILNLFRTEINTCDKQPNTLAAESLMPLPAAAYRFRALPEAPGSQRVRAAIASTRPLDASLLTFAVHGRVFSRDRSYSAALPRP
ncbi:Vanin-like protein 1 protein [Gryllus bimaculatus]|nr:Vanin-like protein 1 protein [Gryllus bimaculatus]